MPRVLLVAPGAWFAQSYGNRWTFPAGMHLVYSHLAAQPGFEVGALDLGRDCGGAPNLQVIPSKLAEAVREVQRGRWEIVAIRCWTSLEWAGAFCLARLLRRRFPGICLVASGWHVTGFPADFLAADSPFDFAIKGGGVAGLLEVGRRRLQSQGREGPELIDAPLFRDTSSFGLDWETFPSLEGCNEVGLYLSFGCPFSCAFCAESLATAGYRVYDPDLAADEVLRAARLPGVKRVLLYDPLFGVRKGWRRRFLERLVQAKFETRLWLEARADTFAEHDLDLLAQLRVDIGMGLDSGSARMLERMHKTRKPEEYLQGFMDINAGLSARGIRHEMFMMFNHPGETLASQEESLEYMRALLDRPGQCGAVVPAGYAHYPGAVTYQSAEPEAFIAYPHWWRAFQDHRSLAEAVVPSADYWQHADQMGQWRERFCQLFETCGPRADPRLQAELPNRLAGVRGAPVFTREQAEPLYAMFQADPQGYAATMDSYLSHSALAMAGMLESAAEAAVAVPADHIRNTP